MLWDHKGTISAIGGKPSQGYLDVSLVEVRVIASRLREVVSAMHLS